MKKVRLLILIMLLGVTLLGCSRRRYSFSSRVYKSNPVMFSANNDKSVFDEETIERKILFSAYISLTVDNPDTANIYIEKIAEKYNGYVNEIGTYKTIIRVKSNNLDSAIEEISALGKVISKNIKGQDVTEDFLDYKIRLENAEKSRKRYLELLAKAENVEAALKVEKELERLNETIDLLKGKMSKIDHLSEYSTITISLKEKIKPGLLGYIGIGLYHSVKWFFVRN